MTVNIKSPILAVVEKIAYNYYVTYEATTSSEGTVKELTQGKEIFSSSLLKAIRNCYILLNLPPSRCYLIRQPVESNQLRVFPIEVFETSIVNILTRFRSKNEH